MSVDKAYTEIIKNKKGKKCRQLAADTICKGEVLEIRNFSSDNFAVHALVKVKKIPSAWGGNSHGAKAKYIKSNMSHHDDDIGKTYRMNNLYRSNGHLPGIEKHTFNEMIETEEGSRLRVIAYNIFRDMFAGIRDIVGGRSGAYEKELAKARRIAFEDIEEEAENLGANAIVGIDLDYEVVGKEGGMLMVSISGTAVSL